MSEDARLVERLQRDDERALSELINVYTRPLGAAAAALLGRTAEVEDILQDVFVALWERRKELRAEENVAGYLYRAVRNRAVDVIRQDRAQQRLADAIAVHLAESASVPNAAERTLEARDVQTQLAAALQLVPKSPRQVFLLSYQHGLTYAEIATVLGVTVETVRKQIYRATQRLATYYLGRSAP